MEKPTFLSAGAISAFLLTLALASGCAHHKAAPASAATTTAAPMTTPTAATPAAKPAPGPRAAPGVLAANGPRGLRFGSGGGITGAATAYTLFPDGRLERRQGMPGDTARAAAPLAAPPAAQVKAAFAAFEELPADSLMLNQPGNMYTFLEGRTTSGRIVRLTWGAPGAKAPHAARALYRDLTALVPKN